MENQNTLTNIAHNSAQGLLYGRM